MKNKIWLLMIPFVLVLSLLTTWENIARAKPDDSPQSDPQELVVAGQYGGHTRAVTWNNDTTYVGIGPSLNILDATASTTPTLLGRSLPLPGIINDISVISTTAYVAVGTGGLSVVDVSDPTAPVKIAEYIPDSEASTNSLRNNPGKPAPLNPLACYDPGDVLYQVHAKGTRVYLAYGWLGLRILDMSDPSNPIEYGNLEPYEWLETMAVYAKGRYAYVVDVDYEYNYSVFRVVDVSNPAKPSVVGLKELGSVTTRGLYVDGDTVYLATDFKGLTIVDVKDPTKPEIVSQFNTPGSAEQVMVSNGLAYVADYHKGLRVIDVSDPAKPKEIGFYEGERRVRDLFILDGTACLADLFGGFLLLDVSDPSQPKKMGAYSVPTAYNKIAVSDQHAYLTHEDQGLGILDVSVPAQIREMDWFQDKDPISVSDVFVDGEIMALAGDRAVAPKHVMSLIDINDPVNLQPLGEYYAPDVIADVYLIGDLAYVAADGNLLVVDISDSENPREISHLVMPNSIVAMDVVSDTVYTVDYYGLRVIDASDPFGLEIRGNYELPYSVAMDVGVSGTTAYVGYFYNGLRIVDVSDPTKPVEIGSYQPKRAGWLEIDHVWPNGDVIYLVEEVTSECDDHLIHSTIRVIDFSDPENPIELGYFQFPARITDLLVEGGSIYATYYQAGLMILRYNDPAVFAHQVYFPMLLK
jgi:hypothetical protein